MGLVINQGIHKDEQPIVSDKEIAQITKLTAAKEDVRKNSLNVELTIISDGKFKGRKLFDLVPYDPDDVMAFKYKALRRAAKVPYDKKEGTSIDIEKLLLNKAVGVKLSVREYEGTDYQNINYFALEGDKKITPVAKAKEAVKAVADEAPKQEVQEDSLPDAMEENKETPAKANTPVPEISDDDFPF